MRMIYLDYGLPMEAVHTDQTRKSEFICTRK